MWESRHANALKSSAETADKLAQDVKDIPIPPEPKPTEEQIHNDKKIRESVRDKILGGLEL
jgi:hypothetical protein